jgi:hypothetical protein
MKTSFVADIAVMGEQGEQRDVISETGGCGSRTGGSI